MYQDPSQVVLIALVLTFQDQFCTKALSGDQWLRTSTLGDMKTNLYFHSYTAATNGGFVGSSRI